MRGQHTQPKPTGRGATRLVAFAAVMLGMVAQVVLGAAPNWENPTGLLNTMTVHAEVIMADTSQVTVPGSMLAAFKDGAIRGVADIFEFGGNQQFQLAVASNEGSESGLTLKCYDAGSDRVFDISETLDFAADTTLGMLPAPVEYNEFVGPVAVGDTAPAAGAISVDENSTQVFNVTATGGVPPYDYTWTLNGSGVFPHDSHFTFSPDYNTVLHPAATAGYTLVCSVSDQDGGTPAVTATWNITVNDVDRLPTAPVIAISPAAPLTTDDLTVSRTSTDPDGDVITYTIEWNNGGAPIAVATLLAANTAQGETWTVDVTADTTPYGGATASSVTVSDAVTIANSSPVADAQTDVSVQKDTTAALVLTGSDADAGDTLTFALGSATTVAGGTLTGFDSATGDVTYTPPAGYTGADSFTFTVTDGDEVSAPATVGLIVFQPFSMDIEVTGAATDLITLGVESGATDNADQGIDSLAPPVFGDVANVYLISPGDGVDLVKDMRPQIDTADFQVVVESNLLGGDDVILDWTGQPLPDGLNWRIWELNELDGQPIDNGIDMATVKTLTIDDGAGTKYFRIGAPSVLSITDVTPATDVTAGGATVVITGTEFAADATVDFGTGNASGSVTVDSDTQLTVVVPAGPFGAVDVIVTNADGGTDTLTDGFSYNDAPTAVAGGPYSIGIGEDLALVGSGSSDPNGGAGDTLTYAWDLDNNGTYEYSAASADVTVDVGDHGLAVGTHTIGLQVTDSLGLTATDTATVDVQNNPPTADTGGPYWIDAGQSLPLDASGSTANDAGDQIVEFSWDFDNDGTYDFVTSAATPNPVPWGTLSAFLQPLAYDTPYTVVLRVKDEYDGTATATTNIRVFDNAPQPSFTISSNPAQAAPNMVTFDPAATDHGKPGVSNVTFEWDFNYNGTNFIVRKSTTSASTVTYTFPTYKHYNVALRVTDENGVARMATEDLEVSDGAALPAAEAGAAISAPVMSDVTLDGSASTGPNADGSGIVSYEWSVGGSVIATGVSPTITSAQLAGLGAQYAGDSVTFTLTITDTLGNTATDTVVVTLTESATNWTFTFDVFFGSELTLDIGIAPDATQGLDAFDSLAGTPLLDGAYTVVHSNDGHALNRAINGTDVDDNGDDTDYADWILEVSAGIDDVYVLWDSADVPAGGMWLVELDNTAGVPEEDGMIPAGAERINMATTDWLYVAAGETAFYRIVFGQITAEIELGTGWNQVSLPVEPIDPATDSIFLPATVTAVTRWDPATTSDVDVTGGTMLPLLGHWVASTTDQTVTVPGIRINDRDFALIEAPQWHMVGVAEMRALADNPDLFLPAYHYNPATGDYDVVLAGDNLEEGKAYWIFAVLSTLLNPTLP
jgi:hypothetical protein